MTAADYDRDGDLDLFVGGRVRPNEYPLPSQSYLLQNEGGRFVLAESTALRDIGMVTAAVWTDLNHDGWLDLALAHEWGPIRILLNTNGSFVDGTADANLAEMLGWWNSISAADIDADGDLDLVVGNYGLNTKYHASKDHPVQIHYGDFDATGNMQIVESEYEGDKLYPVRGKSCSTNAMPFLADKFETYTQFGLAELDEIYSPECLSASVHLKAYELRSGVLINHSGKFEFKPWTRLAQIAPVFGTVICDWNRDGHLDIFAAQNSYSPQRETGHMDGGMGMLLLGNGAGDFQPVAPNQSGIQIPGDAKSAIRLDYDGDFDQDLLVGVNNGRWAVLKNEQLPDAKAAKVLRLQGPAGNRQAIGSHISVTRPNGQQVFEVHAAGGYLSAGVSSVELPKDASELRVRWPDGSQENRAPFRTKMF
ncbi:MAG: CRTAC1 family protein [Pirellulaceae bacterium]